MKWTTKQIPIKELATGENLHITLYTLRGEKPGPHIHIQASVHGAELQGNAVILELMKYLNGQEIVGSISFIPLANPYATDNKHGTYTYGRYNPVTGHNWNRNYIDVIKQTGYSFDDFISKHLNSPWENIKEEFKIELKNLINDYTQKLIHEQKLSENNKLNLILQLLASTADGVLDLHTGPVATRYLYCAEYERDVAKYMKFKHVLLIPNEFDGAMDEASFIPWIHLMNAYKKQGRELQCDVHSLTLEFGSEETFSMENAAKDVESIVNYLKHKKIIHGDASIQNPHLCKLKDYKTIYAPNGGLVDYHFEPGERFIKGDTLASFYNFKLLDPEKPHESCRSSVIASEDGIVINRCPSSSVHQGMELYQIMTNITEFNDVK